MKLEIPHVTAGSLPEYLQRIEELYTGKYSVLFRGQQCEPWDLIPRIGRTRFRRRFSSLVEAERKMMDEFERLVPPHLGGRELPSRWDRLALAQHHGMPTRLLDWTTNPLVALWFAVERPPKEEKDAAVWAFEADESDYVSHQENPFALLKTMVFRPRHLDSRIIAQSGWFTAHKLKETESRFIPLNMNKAQKGRLRKFIIPKQYFPPLRDDLARCGISRASLFPDLAGLCGHIQWQFSPLEDEHGYDECCDLL